MARKHESKTGSTEAPVARWQQVVVLGIAKKEGRELLTAGQYEHVRQLIRQLVGFGRRDFETQLRIEPFEDYWELKDKGGVLGKKNIRVYFAFEQVANEIIVLHVANKQNEGKPPRHLSIRLKNRLRQYRNGELGVGITRYKRVMRSSGRTSFPGGRQKGSV